MALRRETEAVWIDDGVWDMNGVFVAWLDGSDEVPHDKNFEAKYLVYKQPVDSNKSWIYKLLGGVAKAVVRLTDSKDVAERAGFQVSPEPIPKPAIDGYPKGKTVDGVPKAVSSPEKKIIIREDMDGSAPYAESVWDKSGDEETVARLKQRINELEQRLSAEEGKSQELEQEIDREENDNRGRGGHQDLYPEDFQREGEMR